MSEASAHKLSVVSETTRGTTPTNPRFRHLPDTRTTLALSKENLATDRLTGDRFPAEPRTGAKGVGGEIPADLSARAYDDLLASALQGEWVESGGTDSIDIDQDATNHLGDEEGATYATTNGVVTIESIDAKAQEVVLTYNPTAGDTITTHEIFALGAATIDGEVFQLVAYNDAAEDALLKAGSTRKSFSILREFSDFDGGEPFLLFSGCEVASLNISASANALVKATFTLFGRDMVGPSANAPANTSYAPAFNTEPFDTFSGDLEIDSITSCIATELNLDINNGFSARFVVGCETSQNPSIGQSLVTGSVTVYFENSTLLKKFIEEESFSLKTTFADAVGNKLIIDLPNLKIGSGTQPDVAGDGPIVLPINFTAHKDEALGSHISIRRNNPVAV